MKLLLEHLKNNKNALIQLSEMLNLAEHKTNLGIGREGLISNFISQNLPEYIKYHTGEIFDRKNLRSGQIDIILHPITSPKICLSNTINIFPAETVLAAIEVKSNLTTGTSSKKSALNDVVTSCKKLKELTIASKKENNRKCFIDCEKIPYIVFAYKGPKVDILKSKLYDFKSKYEIPLRALPDMFVVLDKGYYLLKKNSWMDKGATIETIYFFNDNKDIVLLGLFELLLKLIEDWSMNLAEHNMPIKQYTKDLPSIFKKIDELNKE